MISNNSHIELIESKFKKYKKWIFPIKGVVVKTCENYRKGKKIRDNLTTAPIVSAILNSVGYCHFKLEERPNKELAVAVGISFIHPDEFSQNDPKLGKEIAVANTKFLDDPDRDKNVTQLYREYTWKGTEFHGGDDWDTAINFGPLSSYIGGVYDKVSITYNFGMRYDFFTKKRHICGNKYGFGMYYDRPIIYQVQLYLLRTIGRYISLKYKNYSEQYCLIKRQNDEDMCVKKESFHYYKIKNNTVIVPMDFRVHIFTGKTKAGRLGYCCEDDDIKTIGYIAIRMENNKWYCGVSYCAPEDLERFNHKHGRKLAYARMMERYEQNTRGVLPWILDRINFHHGSNLPNYYECKENGRTKAIVYDYWRNKDEVEEAVKFLANKTSTNKEVVEDFFYVTGCGQIKEECL